MERNAVAEAIASTATEGVAESYGAYYYQPGTEPTSRDSRPDDLYFYRAFVGSNMVALQPGDSLITLSPGKSEAMWLSAGDGVRHAMVNHFGLMFRGYQCGNKTVSLGERVNLPYINGCATRQLFAPERVGDPTFQQLTIPPYTSEQKHHIHPTARVVYVLKGRGFSIVGQAGNVEETELLPGMVIVLDPMSPHHFRTEGDYLTVLPVHVFSSGPANMDNNHPMFNGTKEV